MKSKLLLAASIVLAGCSSNTRDSSATFLRDGIQLKQDSVVANADQAKVIMKSAGFTHPVRFSVRRSQDVDRRPEILGNVVDSGRGKVFGWIAKMSEVTHSAVVKNFPQLELTANHGEAIEIDGFSSVRIRRPIRTGLLGLAVELSGIEKQFAYNCGPLRSTFTPERQKTYLVEFMIVGQGCEQNVYDITQPKQRIPVIAQESSPGSA